MKVALIVGGIAALVVIGVLIFGLISWLRQDQP